VAAGGGKWAAPWMVAVNLSLMLRAPCVRGFQGFRRPWHHLAPSAAAPENPGRSACSQARRNLACAGQRSVLIMGQLCGGARHLTVDASGLRFADWAWMQALVLAARTLKSWAQAVRREVARCE
jgi:hypothetical protein